MFIKKYMVIIMMLFSASIVLSQTKERKNNISAGGGKESYNGHLGNSWFNFKEECYGFVNINYSRYINNSFDALVFATVGDIGRCRDDDAPLTVLNLYSRMSSAILTFKYKFTNGYILKENAKIAPFVFLGAGINNLVDIWNHKDCNPGNNLTLNGGLGVNYNFTERFSLGCRMNFGYFTKAGAMDYYKGGKDAMYMQTAFYLGVNF